MSDKRARPLTTQEFARLSRAKDFDPRTPVARDVGEVPPPVVEGGILRDVIMSTSTVDRADDTVSQSGWDLVDFIKNPVLLWCHDMWSPPIGTVASPSVRTLETGTQQLVAPSIEFAPREVNPFGAMVGALYTHPKRFARAFSVGFRPKKWNYNEERGGIDFLEQALLELSCCAIGMNQECLSGAKSAGIQVDLLLPFAEKRLDGDASAPLWMEPEFAGAVYRSLVPRTHQVPGGAPKKKDPERKRILAALEVQGRAVELLTEQVRTLTDAVVAQQRAPAAPTSVVVHPTKAFDPARVAALTGRILDTKLAAITGRVVDE
ncbi:hypothetical protein [Myxococcus virescens]|uniref:Uncharacterized protein n=1 Tax=Myxococcus virescens TaxID=83456 RepID=A0A511HNP2_9BACT|nr:hypothetical protein [Myxococcus virescens]GEL75201.1 hypothetical protein MVI01_69850 [Myxococcus virescens]SDD65107.1 hypothetical protein SAMN04488504_102126 [Myxococcus virescens]